MSSFYVHPTTLSFISVLITLAGQILLCYKAKKVVIKLIPIMVLVASMLVFFVCSAAAVGLDGIGYLFFGLLSFGLIFVCGIGWGIWALTKN